jgi:hypothetical protein
VALRVNSSKVEGVYKDNLPRVAGVKVEVKKTKKDISKPVRPSVRSGLNPPPAGLIPTANPFI